MYLILFFVATLSFLTTIGTVYYAFYRQPDKWKKLKSDIAETTSLIQKLTESVATLTKDKNELTKEYQNLKSETEKLNKEWNSLSSKLSNGQQQLKQIEIDKIKSENENIRLQKESDKLKTVEGELSTLTNKRNSLLTTVNSIQETEKKLKDETSKLQERKTELEKENSELQIKVVQKKNSYKVKTYEFTEVPPIKAFKHIGYIPQNRFGANCFPSVFMPKEKTRIKFPRKVSRHLQPTGETETAFAEEIRNHFNKQYGIDLYTNRVLVISDKTLPYEPDIVLQDERDNLNLFIDIEIDEPYDMVNRFATHFKDKDNKGKDDYRNKYFTDRGWIVIRFSERQVHLFPKECCRLIAEVIKDIAPIKFQIPQSLSELAIVKQESFWNKVQSEKWERQKYREKYLGISGVIVDNGKGIVVSENVQQTQDEKEVELGILKEDDDPIYSKWWNERNKHYRDSRIKFESKEHRYLIDNNENYTSATTLIYRFFEEFDGDRIAEIIERVKGIPAKETLNKYKIEGEQSRNEGTQLHLDIDNYFETGKEKSTKEFQHFLNFYEEKLGKPVPYRTEWRIFDDIRYVAGTADLVLKKPDGTLAIYDWKRSKEIKQFGFRDFHTGETAKGFGICSDLEHANYYHYCIQLNIYKRILEEFYDKEVSEMYFVQLHPNFERYNLIEVKDMQETVDKMFSTL